MVPIAFCLLLITIIELAFQESMVYIVSYPDLTLLRTIQNYRELIMQELGIPSHILFGDETNARKHGFS